MRHTAKRHRRAFTLIELLIVVAIIAVLAGMLFPVFARARENARRASCAANLKQIGLAILQYTQDYDETFPRRTFYNPYRSWQQVLWPYMKSTQILLCQSNTNNSRVVSSESEGYPEVRLSYAYNPRFGNDDALPPGLPLAYVQQTSRKIVVAEIFNQDGNNWTDYGSPWWWNSPHNWHQGFAGHLSTANYLFADGRVKALRPSSTATPFNMWGGMDVGACSPRDVNCDNIEASMVTGLQGLDARY